MNFFQRYLVEGGRYYYVLWALEYAQYDCQLFQGRWHLRRMALQQQEQEAEVSLDPLGHYLKFYIEGVREVAISNQH